jgi:hypothetical protein
MFPVQTEYNNRLAKDLGSRLVAGATNPEPSVFDLPNPAHGVHIRKIVPACGLRPNVSQEIKDHNSRVSGVGDPAQFSHLWGNHE